MRTRLGAGGRRALLLVGAAAATAGLLAAVWRGQHATRPAEGEKAGDLWAMRFARPGGGELAMATLRGRPLVINFWATWCPPCIREMPQIDRFARQFAGNGWQVLGLAADQEKPVQDFLSRNPVGYPIALAGFEGIALSRRLGNEAGGLPFTVAFDAQGRIVQRHLGETSFEVLAAWAAGQAPTPTR